MEYCEKCGSTSRSHDGFCGGCGAPWPLGKQLSASSATVSDSASAALSPMLRLKNSFADFGNASTQPRSRTMALLLALFFGPAGLYYTSPTGCGIMMLVSIALRLQFGYLATLLVIPACLIWAWFGTRDEE